MTTIEMQCVVLEDVTEAYDYVRLTSEAKMVLGEASGGATNLGALLDKARDTELSTAEIHRALRTLCVERRLRKDSDDNYYITADGQHILNNIAQVEWVIESVGASPFRLSDTEGCLMPSLTANLLNVANKHNALKVELSQRPYGKFVVLMPKAKAVEGHEAAISSAVYNTLKQIFYWRDNA